MEKQNYYATEINGKCRIELLNGNKINFDLLDLEQFVYDKGFNSWIDDEIGRTIEVSPSHWLDDSENWPMACEAYFKEVINQNIAMYNEDFRIGSHRIDDNSVSLLFLDLPYGTTKNKWDIIIPFDGIWQIANRILKPNGVVVFTAAGLFTSKVVMSNPEMYKYSLVWEKTTKTNFLNSKKQFLRSHEDIVVFYDKQPVFNPIITSGHIRKVSTADHKRNSITTTNYNHHAKSSYDSTNRFSGSVLKFSNDKQKSSINPTQKPVALLESLFSVFSNEGDLICDFTAGSFSSAVSAKNLKRKYIGFEICEDQFNKAIKRVFNDYE